MPKSFHDLLENLDSKSHNFVIFARKMFYKRLWLQGKKHRVVKNNRIRLKEKIFFIKYCKI
jgi:hypothetical protein